MDENAEAELWAERADELKFTSQREKLKSPTPLDSRCYIEPGRGMQMIIKPRCANAASAHG